MKKLLPLLLLLAACDGNGATASTATLEFSTRRETVERIGVAPRIDAEGGIVTITGVLVTGCVNQRVGGAVDGTGAVLVLTLTPNQDGACLTALDYVAYEARVGNLPAGPYLVRVRVDPGFGRAHATIGERHVRID